MVNSRNLKANIGSSLVNVNFKAVFDEEFQILKKFKYIEI